MFEERAWPVKLLPLRGLGFPGGLCQGPLEEPPVAWVTNAPSAPLLLMVAITGAKVVLVVTALAPFLLSWPSPSSHTPLESVTGGGISQQRNSRLSGVCDLPNIAL